MVGVRYVASCSFGKDSTAMVLKLIEEGKPLDEVAFYDTGMEFEAIYKVRDMLIPIIKNTGIEYTELRPEENFLYSMLAKPVRSDKKGFHYGYGYADGEPRRKPKSLTVTRKAATSMWGLRRMSRNAWKG